MTQDTLNRLLESFAAGGIGHLEYAEGESRLVLDAPVAVVAAPAAAPVAAAPAAVPAAPQAQADAPSITAPLVGTFYAASAPDAAPFVKVGDTVRKGQTVCILEAMKMINEVPAPCDCVIEAVLAQDGALVGFGDPLFTIREL